MKTKKHYGRPEMTVVELRQECCILAVSGQSSASAGMSVTYDEEEIWGIDNWSLGFAAFTKAERRLKEFS